MAPSPAQIRRVYKPAVFVLCLLPFLKLAAATLSDAGLLHFRLPGLGRLTLGADPIAYVLHTLGDWGLKFLVLTLAVTPIRTIFKMPWLIAFRRMLGLYAFFYVLMHFLTWLLLDQRLYWAGIVEDIGKRPFITIGFLAFLMLIPLAVTSTNGMVRRLGGKRWQKLHRLVYAIVLLGVWHFYWQVKKDVREPLVYFAIIVVLLGWRVWHARAKKTKLRANQAANLS